MDFPAPPPSRPSSRSSTVYPQASITSRKQNRLFGNCYGNQGEHVFILVAHLVVVFLPHLVELIAIKCLFTTNPWVFQNNVVPLCSFYLRKYMESDKPTVEELIAAVLIDIEQKGFSAIQPFSIGDVELRMKHFAQNNGIALACEQLYMSAKQLQHCMRASKGAKGLVVSAEELVRFPKSRFKMDLYYDGECFIYTDEVSKFIIHPNSLVSC